MITNSSCLAHSHGLPLRLWQKLNMCSCPSKHVLFVRRQLSSVCFRAYVISSSSSDLAAQALVGGAPFDDIEGIRDT